MKYAILSDIHANLQALTTVLEKCKELGVEKYICIGDIVGYNANPAECMKIMSELDIVGVVKGNHDEYVSNNDEEMLGFNQHAKAAVLWTKAQLSEEQRNFLARLQYKTIIKGAPITIVHATLDSPESWGYIFDIHQARDNFNYQFSQICFCGHSHVPIAFIKKGFAGGAASVEEILSWKGDFTNPENDPDPEIIIEKNCKYLINVGSVGQPRNRDPRASFSVYDVSAGKITRYRLQYDIESAQKSIIEAGLPERLALRLAKGS
ncbi:MAG TPA: metallophosphoesterase family protein [Victivallales bacterium]|nr:metallophosphoesterase family protein [Victivallales bacterium]